MIKEKVELKHLIPIGFTIFAIFFGAGNLIFPPYLGVITGEHWVTAMTGFLVGDVVFGGLALISTLRELRAPVGIYARIGKKYSIFMGALFYLFTIALFCFPRTGATAFEVGIRPLFPEFNNIIWELLFFGLTWCLAIRPTKVVDYVGKILTPALIVLIFFLVAKGVINPVGVPRTDSFVDGLFAEGLMQGYNTMDMSAGIMTGGVVLTAAVGYGYKKEKVIQGLITKATIIGCAVLAIVYLGLCFLGACISQQYTSMDGIEQTATLVEVVGAVLGTKGQAILGIVAVLACLTTSIGMVTATSTFFNRSFPNKLNYNVWVTLFTVIGAGISVVGVSRIISICLPMINLIIPAMVTGIFMTLLNNRIKNDWVFRVGSYVAFFMGFLSLFNLGFMAKLPLAGIGFGWVLPVVAAVIITLIVTKNEPSEGWKFHDGEDVIESIDEIS